MKKEHAILESTLMDKAIASSSAHMIPDLVFTVTHLNKKGFKAFVVGGAVRDMLLGKDPKDFDICTDALIETVKEAFQGWAAAGELSIIDTGIEHGTITLVWKKSKAEFEITRFRKDVSTDGRRATVAFTNDIMEDLNRRDLTINAIAWDINKERLITAKDFDGIGDLLRGRLTFVGTASERIEEDHLRALRFLRFSVQLSEFGFTINDSVWNNQILPIFDESVLSFERVIMELDKILKHSFKLSIEDQSRVAVRLSELNLLKRLGISNQDHQGLIFNHMVKTGSFWPLIEDVLETNNHDLNKTATIIKLPAKEIKFVSKIITLKIEHISIIRILQDIMTIIGDIDFALDHTKDIASLFNDDRSNQKEFHDALLQIKNENLPFSLKHLDIDGQDLMDLGMKGKKIGETLSKCLNLVKSSNKMNNKELLLNIINE